jgi:hypothetical protein
MPRSERLSRPVNKSCGQGRQFGIFAGQTKLFRDIQSCWSLTIVSFNNAKMFWELCHFRIAALIAGGVTITAYEQRHRILCRDSRWAHLDRTRAVHDEYAIENVIG